MLLRQVKASTHRILKLLDRLDQLAKVVIYSRQHLLLAPHVVGPAETLEQIGQKYNVPWRLLAKINGILEPDTLRVGEELTVVQGPFRAEIDVAKFELTLFLGEYYAGRFPIALGAAAQFSQDALVVRNMEYRGPNNPSGDYWIDLGDLLGIHAAGDPKCVGGACQGGCVGMTERDVDDVFDILATGCQVTIRR